MYNHTNKASVFTFHHFNRKGWSLFSCLHREVRIGVLSVATLVSAAPRLLMASPMHTEGTADTAYTLATDTLTLAEASVTVSRAPLAAAVAARQVVTLTRDDLEAAGVSTINDVLKLTAGVDVRQRGGFGIQTDISIYGGTHDQICILLNGVPIVNPQTGHNAADFPVNLSDIERVEVLQGAASRVMGCQAFSGAVNVVTHRKNAHHIEAQLQGGSYGTFRSEARTALQWGNAWSASASGSWQRSDGAVKNGNFKGGKGYGRLSYESNRFTFDFQTGATANDFGANTFYSAAYPNQWEATRRYIVSARAESKGRVHLIPQLSWIRSTDHFQLTKHSAAGENFHRTDVFAASLNAWTDWKLGRTAVGAEVREENIFSTNLGLPLTEDEYVHIPGEPGKYYTRRADRTNLSYFLEHNVVWRQFSLSAGVMATRNSQLDGRFRFSPGIDVSYRPSSVWRIYASWNRSQRLPTFTDLWYKSPTQEGNTGLLPEENTAYALGATYADAAVRVAVNAHYNRGSHIIDWVMRTPDDKYHASSFGLDNYGVDLDATVYLDHIFGNNQPFERLSVSYAWLYQHRRKGEDYYKSNYAMEYLRHKFVATLRHRIVSRLSASWTLRVQQRQGAWIEYRDAKPTGILRPYGTHALLDCRLDWTARNYSFFADLSNLTSHRYYDLANVRQPGFMVLGGVKVRF